MRGIRFHSIVMRWRHALPYSTRSVRCAQNSSSHLLVFIADQSTVDACPRKPTAAWAAHLCSEHPTLLSRAAFSFQAPPAPLCMDTTSNTTAGPQRLRSSTRKHMSLEAELDLDTDAGANGDSRPTCKNRSDAVAMTTMTKEPRTPEKENTIRRRLRQGPAAVVTPTPTLMLIRIRMLAATGSRLERWRRRRQRQQQR